MTYDPQVNDYVKWKGHEGWVYFRDDIYITIEIGTLVKKEKHLANGTYHKKDHILLVCYSYLWHELEYVKKRESRYDN